MVFGKQRRLVVCHSDGLHDNQSRGFDQTLAKAHRQLAEVQARLARGRTRKAKEKVEAEIAAIVAPRWVARVVATTVTGKAPAELRLGFHTDDHARAELEEQLFGKRILFARQDRGASDDRHDRRRLPLPGGGRGRLPANRKAAVSFSPMFHFTESKIRVHVFYCVLALMVARLMIREAEHARMHMSVRELLGHLAGIREETLLLYQGERGRPPRPAHAHRDGPHPAPPLRPVRTRRLRPEPMSSRYYSPAQQTAPLKWDNLNWSWAIPGPREALGFDRARPWGLTARGLGV